MIKSTFSRVFLRNELTTKIFTDVFFNTRKNIGPCAESIDRRPISSELKRRCPVLSINSSLSSRAKSKEVRSGRACHQFSSDEKIILESLCYPTNAPCRAIPSIDNATIKRFSDKKLRSMVSINEIVPPWQPA